MKTGLFILISVLCSLIWGIERGTLLLQTGVGITGWGGRGMIILKDMKTGSTDTLVRTSSFGACFSPDARKVAYMDSLRWIHTIDIFSRQVRNYPVQNGGGDHVLSWADDGLYITKWRYVIRMDTADASLDTVYRAKLTQIIAAIDSNKIDLTQGGVSLDGKRGAYTIVVDNSGSSNHAWSLDFETGVESVMNDGTTSGTGGRLSCQAAISANGAFVGHTNFNHSAGYLKLFNQNTPAHRKAMGGGGYWFFRFPRNSSCHAFFRTTSDTVTYLWNFETATKWPVSKLYTGVSDACMGGWILDTIPANTPLSLSAKADDYTVSLIWTPPGTASDGDPAADYVIERNNIRIGVSETPSFIDWTAQPESGYVYKVYARDDGVRLSFPAELNVVTHMDNAPPRIIAAYSIQDSTKIRLVFSEAVDSASAVMASHYSLTPSVPIIGAVVLSATEVLLTTSAFTAVRDYCIKTSGVADRHSPANISANDSFPLFVLRATVYSTGRKPYWSLVMPDSANSPDDAAFEKWPSVVPDVYKRQNYLKAWYGDLSVPDTTPHVTFRTNRRAEIIAISSAGLKYCRWLSNWVKMDGNFIGCDIFTKTIDSGLFTANGSGWPTGVDRSSNLYLVRAMDDSIMPNSPLNTRNGRTLTALAARPNLFAAPNPFSGRTLIHLNAPSNKANADFTLQLFDVRGRLIKTFFNRKITAGEYVVALENRNIRLVNGIYFCRAKGGTFEKSIKLILVQ